MSIPPRVRLWAAWVVLLATIAGWPVSALWLARGEPQFVLGLSWMALTLTALDILATTDTRVAVDKEGQ